MLVSFIVTISNTIIKQIYFRYDIMITMLYRADIRNMMDIHILILFNFSRFGYEINSGCNNHIPTYLLRYNHFIFQTDENVWDKIFEVNVKCSWMLAKEVYPELKKRGGGSIIFVSSIAGYQPMEVHRQTL